MLWNYRAALRCRSLAFFAIAYQIHLIAGDLSDAPVFAASIAAAFIIPFIVRKYIKKMLPALIALLFIPLMARFFICLPRYVLPDTAISAIIKFDTLLLDFDRNSFVGGFPFYWITLSTFFACSYRRFARFAILFDCLILALTYSFTKSADISLYRLPIVKIIVFSGIVLLQLFAILFSSPPALKPKRVEKGAAIAFLVILCLISGVLLIRPMQESALEMNGGLMQPKLFSFDFAPFLRLENEIKMSNDLVFIVRKNTADAIESNTDQNNSDANQNYYRSDDGRTLGVYDDHFLMRRYVLSRYNGGGGKDSSVGFMRDDVIDENAQAGTLPRGSKEYDVRGTKSRRNLNQEYYLVNIDGSAFIAMNEPEKVVPFESWDASSFKSAYSVSSMVSDATPIDLYHATTSTTKAAPSTSNAETVYPRYYTVVARGSGTDSLRSIAGLPGVYNDQNKWPLIYRANRQQLPDPANPNLIRAGLVLEIPPLKNERREGAYNFNIAYPSISEKTFQEKPAENNSVLDTASGDMLLGLTEDEFQYYTDFGNRDAEREKRIADLTKSLINGNEKYWEKVQTIYQYLKYGNYRYSLKPGIAPDGDQLTYFLFDAKKGYCSYFAFAYAAMLRSVHIPCRVAIGFFLDLEEDKLGFFPIRSNMAHAWVEVWFPEYGWIEYDPTTEQMAEGEQFDFAMGGAPDAFERLMKEILDNHNKLKAKEAVDEDAPTFASVRKKVIAVIKSWMPPFVILCIIICFILIRYRYLLQSKLTKNRRKKTILLWAHLKTILRLCGYTKKHDVMEDVWVRELCGIKPVEAPFIDLYQCVSAAKFAEEYQQTMENEFYNQYKKFAAWYKNTIPLSRRILTIVCPPAALVIKPHLLIVLLAMALFAGSVGDVQGQDFGGTDEWGEPVGDYGEENFDADSLFHAAREAQNNEFWEKAIERYTLGKKQFPLDKRFPLALGDLYLGRQLFRLAKDEFLICEKTNPNDPYLLSLLAQVSGTLNENKMSAHYYERLLAIDPGDRGAIGALGWMYLKLHRLDDGEQLLQNALKRWGDDPDYLMTLATIYSDMLDYENGRKYYFESIDLTKNEGYNSFASVCYYNMSILNSRFYDFDEANRSSIESIMMQDRSSGHLARGELHLRRLDFKETFRDYEISYEQDTSPLTKVNLSLAYLCAGRLSEALAYAYDCLNQQNMSWMLSYSIDPDSYKRDLYEIIYKTYTGMAKTEKFIVHTSIKEKIKGLGMIAYYRFMAKISKLRYQKYCARSSNAIYQDMSTEGQLLESLKFYYLTMSDYQHRAQYYLTKAQNIELNFIPGALPSYLYEEGKLQKSESTLREAIERFDPVWEQDMIAETYAEMAMFTQKKLPSVRKKELLREVSGKLYAMNSGALRQHGLSLPVNLEITADGNVKEAMLQRKITRFLHKAGFSGGKQGDERFTLRIVMNTDVYCEIYDNARGMATLRETFALKSDSSKDIAAFVNNVAAAAFTGK